MSISDLFYRPGGIPKPVKGSARAARVQDRKAIEADERREKTKVRKRDRACRWPGCDCPARRDRLEVAHLRAKGVGGDHGRRSTADQMILLCVARHQGRPSLHSGDLRIVPLTADGTDGPVAFQERRGARWVTVARERAAGIVERVA